MARVLRSGWLTSGREVERFEAEFAAAVGAPEALAVNSGTAALHLALAALDLKTGDEVIVPAMTFAATAEVVWHCGARPVLADCDAATLNLTPAAAARAVTRRSRALMPVHFGGRPCEMAALREIARARGLAMVVDAAHAFPARENGLAVGAARGAAEATAFSFYATKTLTTGEGGMLTGANARRARRLRSLRLHGLSAAAWGRHRRGATPHYEILAPGFKYNLTDLAAAIGRAQLRRAAGARRNRAGIAAFYSAALAEGPALEAPPPAAGGETHAWHLYVVQLRLEQLRIGRDRFLEELRRRGVGASVHFKPLHMHSWYRRAGYSAAMLPAATRAFPRLISLPIYPDLTPAERERVAAAALEVARRFRR